MSMCKIVITGVSPVYLLSFFRCGRFMCLLCPSSLFLPARSLCSAAGEPSADLLLWQPGPFPLWPCPSVKSPPVPSGQKGMTSSPLKLPASALVGVRTCRLLVLMFPPAASAERYLHGYCAGAAAR